VHGHRDVGEGVDPEDASGCEEPHKLLSGGATASRPSELGHDVVAMQSQKVHELERGGREAADPTSSGPRRYGRVGLPSGVTRDRASHGAPAPPEMARDERREHPPGGTAVGRGADVSDDPDAHHTLLAGKRAMEMVVDV
jgi:hypothetical protein